jgi:hypothetical protein
VLNDAKARVASLDSTIDGAAIARALAIDLGGDPRALRDRTDRLIVALRSELVDLVVQPRLLTSSGRPSPAAERRSRRCRLSFDEGYLVGRVGLDTHRVALRWSDTAAATAVPHPMATLRSLALHPALAAAYAATERLEPLVTDLAVETRGLPADQAAQFAGLGLLTAVAEWTLLVGTHRDVEHVLVPS